MRLARGACIGTVALSLFAIACSSVPDATLTNDRNDVTERSDSPAPSSSSSSTKTTPSTPEPTVAAISISTVDPPTVAAGTVPATGLQVRLTGTGFVNGDLLDVGGGQRISTTVTSTTSLTAVIPAAKLTTPGSLSLGLVAPNASGPSSNVVLLVSGNATSIATLTPASVLSNSGATLVVAGAGFTSDSVVSLQGTDLKTHFQGSTLLTADLTSSQTKTAGSFIVFVRNSAGVSPPKPFEITGGSSGSCGGFGSCSSNDVGFCFTDGTFCASDRCFHDGSAFGCGRAGNCNGGATCSQVGLSEGQCTFDLGTFGFISCSNGCAFVGC